MCSIKWIHKEFKRRYNKLDSNHKLDFPPAFIDDIARQSLIDYVNLPFTANKSKKYVIPFDATQYKRDMLRTLIECVELELRTIDQCKWSVELPEDYFHELRAFYTNTQCSTCDPVNIDFKEYDDLNLMLKDPNDKPSVKWGRLIGRIKGDLIQIYSDVEIDKIMFEYIRQPAKVFVGGYNTLEYVEGDLDAPNSLSGAVDPDIPDTYCDLLVELMIQNVSADLYDSQQLNIRQERVSARL